MRFASHLHRNRFGVLYFRRAVPPDLRRFFNRREIYRSLGTARKSEAVSQVRALSARTDLLFAWLRQTMGKKGDKLNRVDLIWRLHAKDLGLNAEVEAEPHELEGAKELVSHTVAELGKLSQARGVSGPPKADESPLSSIVDKYLAEFERGGARRETVLDYRGDFNQFKALFGEVFMSQLTHERLNEVKEKLVRLPANMNKLVGLRGKPIDDILLMGLPAQSAITVRKKWQRLESFFDWAVRHGYAQANLAKGKKPKARAASYEKFSQQDLETLFGTTEYSQAAFDEAFQYWMPLIGLYTGARLEEIAQLHLADVCLDEPTGIHYLNITTEVDESDGAQEMKHLKNEASARHCPIHSALITAGLLKYVECLKTRGHDRLFPELSQDIYGKFSPRASEWFTAYRRKCGVGTDRGRSKKAFHSFRHTMVTALQREGVPVELREALVGHAPTGVNVRVYSDRPPLAHLKEQIEKLDYGIAVAQFVERPQYEEARVRAKARARGKGR